MRLIDIFVAESKLWAWLTDGQFFELTFSPKVYVFASRSSLAKVEAALKEKGVESKVTQRRTLKGEKTVLEVVSTVADVRSVCRYLERFGKYSYEIFNSDIPLPEYYMFTHGLFPGCNVEFELSKNNRQITNMWTNERPDDEYEVPSLSKITIGVETYGDIYKPQFPKLKSILLDGEPMTVQDFVCEFRKKDPDMILAEDGCVELPYILSQVRKEFPNFSFSRFGRDSFESKSGSYFSYGKTIFMRNGIYLKGRLHFGPRGVLYGRWNLSYPFELARFCVTPLQKINHRSAGFGVTNLQLSYAVRKGFMIPNKSSCVERWKSGLELFSADRGSLIYEPIVGFHTDIAEIDFISLYPNIMVKKNISTETLFCKCCPKNLVPGLRINICIRERGIIPESLEPIIRQRLIYKNSKKKHLIGRSDALKGLLVTSFGYMGFRKSKFARIESHQAIQAYARETLLAATKVAEENGFEVVHGIVDSLWVKKNGIDKKQCMNLIEKIRQETGFESKLEGVYRWLVFLPSTQNGDVPVPTRYYGVFEDGEIKCRGIGLRRHDTPKIIKELEKSIITNLADATNYDEFRSRMVSSMVHVREAIAKISEGCSESLLQFNKSISKTSYKGQIAQAVIVKKLQDEGFTISPGQFISYVIADRYSKNPKHRYNLPGMGKYDRLEYAILARKAAENLFAPFIDVSIEERQTTIHGCLRNDDSGVKAKGLPLRIKERAF